MDALFGGCSIAGALIASGKYHFEPIPIEPTTTTQVQGATTWYSQITTSHDITLLIAAGQVGNSAGELMLPVGAAGSIMAGIRTSSNSASMATITFIIVSNRVIEMRIAQSGWYPAPGIGYIYELWGRGKIAAPNSSNECSLTEIHVMDVLFGGCSLASAAISNSGLQLAIEPISYSLSTLSTDASHGIDTNYPHVTATLTHQPFMVALYISGGSQGYSHGESWLSPDSAIFTYVGGSPISIRLVGKYLHAQVPGGINMTTWPTGHPIPSYNIYKLWSCGPESHRPTSVTSVLFSVQSYMDGFNSFLGALIGGCIGGTYGVEFVKIPSGNASGKTTISFQQNASAVLLGTGVSTIEWGIYTVGACPTAYDFSFKILEKSIEANPSYSASSNPWSLYIKSIIVIYTTW